MIISNLSNNYFWSFRRLVNYFSNFSLPLKINFETDKTKTEKLGVSYFHRPHSIQLCSITKGLRDVLSTEWQYFS